MTSINPYSYRSFEPTSYSGPVTPKTKSGRTVKHIERAKGTPTIQKTYAAYATSADKGKRGNGYFQDPEVDRSRKKRKGQERQKGILWSKEEDNLLRAAVEPHKSAKKIPWTRLAKQIKGRDSVQCFHRWVNYLDPELAKTPVSQMEMNLISQLASHPDYQGKVKGTVCWKEIAGEVASMFGVKRSQPVLRQTFKSWERGTQAPVRRREKPYAAYLSSVSPHSTEMNSMSANFRFPPPFPMSTAASLPSLLEQSPCSFTPDLGISPLSLPQVLIDEDPFFALDSVEEDWLTPLGCDFLRMNVEHLFC